MKNQCSINNSLVLAVIILVSFLAQSGVAETGFDKEFWISTSTNTSNLGTLDNPFDGSTESNFDQTMGGLPPNCTIHLLAGTYETYGCCQWRLKDGQKLLGSGIDVTVLQLIPTNGYPIDDVLGDASVASFADTNIQISDLTCDCNYQSGDYKLGGIGLGGTNHLVERVKVVRFGGPGGEAVGINIGGGYGNIIENCEVSGYVGGTQATAIGLIGSGVVRNNRVLYPAVTNGGVLFAFGAIGRDILVEGNYVDGANVGFYNDTDYSTNIIITDNSFENVFSGVAWYDNGNVRRNVTVSYNTIMLSTNGPNGFGGYPKYAIFIGDAATNFNVIGNIVGWDGEPQPAELGYDYSLTTDGAQGLLVADNRFDARMEGYLRENPDNGYVAHDNYDFAGNLLTNIDQTLPYTSQWLPIGKIDGTAASFFDVLPGWVGNVGGTWWGNGAKPSAMGGQVTNLVFAVSVLTTNAGTFTFRAKFSGADKINQFSEPEFTTNLVSAAGTNINTISFNYAWADATNPWTSLAGYVWMNDNMNNTNVVIAGGSFTAH
jgi:hypothetical protein